MFRGFLFINRVTIGHHGDIVEPSIVNLLDCIFIAMFPLMHENAGSTEKGKAICKNCQKFVICIENNMWKEKT